MRIAPWLIVGSLALGACHFKGDEARERRVKLGGWPFQPVSVRIHPFTSLRLAGMGGPSLDARIEFIDPAGDVTKGVGDLRFELYAEPAKESREGEELRIY